MSCLFLGPLHFHFSNFPRLKKNRNSVVLFFPGWDDLGLQKYKVSEEAMKNCILHLEYPVFHVQDKEKTICGNS